MSRRKDLLTYVVSSPLQLVPRFILPTGPDTSAYMKNIVLIFSMITYVVGAH